MRGDDSIVAVQPNRKHIVDTNHANSVRYRRPDVIVRVADLRPAGDVRSPSEGCNDLPPNEGQMVEHNASGDGALSLLSIPKLRKILPKAWKLPNYQKLVRATSQYGSTPTRQFALRFAGGAILVVLLVIVLNVMFGSRPSSPDARVDPWNDASTALRVPGKTKNSSSLANYPSLPVKSPSTGRAERHQDQNNADYLADNSARTSTTNETELSNSAQSQHTIDDASQASPPESAIVETMPPQSQPIDANGSREATIAQSRETINQPDSDRTSVIPERPWSNTGPKIRPDDQSGLASMPTNQSTGRRDSSTPNSDPRRFGPEASESNPASRYASKYPSTSHGRFNFDSQRHGYEGRPHNQDTTRQYRMARRPPQSYGNITPPGRSNPYPVTLGRPEFDPDTARRENQSPGYRQPFQAGTHERY